MKKLIWTLSAVLKLNLVLVPCAEGNGYKAMAREFAHGALREGVERVAVLPFIPTDGGNPNEGWNISEKLTTQLVRAGQVKTVERGMLKKLMEEHYLARTGIVDPSSLRRLGRILSVDAVVTGSFSTLGSHVSVNARLIHIETGVIIAACEKSLAREWLDSGSASGPRVDALMAKYDPIPQPSPQSASPPPLVDAEEASDLRDSPAEPGCTRAAERADALERSILELKARYWAGQLEKGVSFSKLKTDPAATITDGDLRRRFYERVQYYYGNDDLPALSAAEVRKFIAADGMAFHIHSECGI